MTKIFFKYEYKPTCLSSTKDKILLLVFAINTYLVSLFITYLEFWPEYKMEMLKAKKIQENSYHLV